MSTAPKKCPPFLAAVMALGVLWAAPSAIAQSSSAPSNVLPTGGGQGLIDPTDSVMLLPVRAARTVRGAQGRGERLG
jgi:hypothetical protein